MICDPVYAWGIAAFAKLKTNRKFISIHIDRKRAGYRESCDDYFMKGKFYGAIDFH